MQTSGVKPYLWALCACGFFALMALLTHKLGQPAGPDGLPACPWTVVAFVRSIVATVCAAGMTVLVGATFVVVRPRTMWIRSLAGSTSMMATFYALARLQASEVLTLTNTSPVWVAILSWPLGRDRPTAGVWAAVACAVAGVAVATRPHGDGFDPGPSAAALFAAFFTAVAMLGLNRLKGIHPFAVVTHFSAVSALFGLAAWLAAAVFHVPIDAPGDPHWYEHAGVWSGIVGVGLTATAGQVFLTLAFSRGVATRVSVVGLSQVVLVMAGEAALGWHALTPVVGLGTAMVLGPTAWLILHARKPRVGPQTVAVPAAADEVKAA